MIDSKGYRLNVGIIICNDSGQLLWARRSGLESWQFPQGGIQRNEDPCAAMYRELYEETGLKRKHVRIIGRTKSWLHYNLPKRYIRKRSTPLCIGQKQLWYMLRLVSDDQQVRFDCSAKPEFDDWRWVNFWYPLSDVVFFKKDVYRRAMGELGTFLLSDSVPVSAVGFLCEEERHDAERACRAVHRRKSSHHTRRRAKKSDNGGPMCGGVSPTTS